MITTVTVPTIWMRRTAVSTTDYIFYKEKGVGGVILTVLFRPTRVWYAISLVGMGYIKLPCNRLHM